MTAIREQAQEPLLGAVMMLAEALDRRDTGPDPHSKVVGSFAKEIAVALGLASDRVVRIETAGVLHDVGKLGISDSVLFKPGRLDKYEWREVQRHPELGARILDHAGIHDIATWVRAHHERVDGQGYPRMLREGEIPLEARILAVVDAYEAMVAERPYSPAMSVGEASEQLRRGAGTQFDSAIVEAFLSTLNGADGMDGAE